MPPKSKSKPGDEWIVCELCGSRLSSKNDRDKHQSKDCKRETVFQPSNFLLSSLKYGFVKDQFVVASLTFQEDFVGVPSQYQEKILYLNPSTMDELGVTYLAPVVLNHRHVLYVKPGKSLNLTSVALRGSWKQAVGDASAHCIIYPLSRHKVLRMKEVLLNQRNKSIVPLNQNILEFLRQQREYIPMNEDFSLIFLGVDHIFYVDNVDISATLQLNNLSNTEINSDFLLQSSSKSDNKNKDVTEISEKLHDLRINSRSSNQNSAETSEKLYNGEDERAVKWIQLTRDTVLSVAETRTESKNKLGVTLDDVGGYSEIKKKLLDYVNHLKRNYTDCDVGGYSDIKRKLLDYVNHLKRNHTDNGPLPVMPRSVILHGPAGTGKSMLVKALAHSSDLPLITADTQQYTSRYIGETERYLQSFFSDLKSKGSCVMFFDNLNKICPRESLHGDASSSWRLSEQFTRELSSLLSCSDKVFVIAAVTKLEDLSTTVRNRRCFQEEFEIGVPTREERYDVLRNQLGENHSLNDKETKLISDAAHGFVGADLKTVCDEARIHLQMSYGDVLPSSSFSDKLTYEILRSALSRVVPSAMKEIAIEKPTISWSDVAIPDSLHSELRRAIDLPLRHPEVFTRLKLTPCKGILLYGPPGCSKTLIAKAIASESGLNFISVKAGELFGKFVGQSEQSVREIFKKARSAAPSVLFFDEIDALAASRGGSREEAGGVSDRVVGQLLAEMDGVAPLQQVFIVAATNRPDNIDHAIRRSGRFDKLWYVPLPAENIRRQIFEIKFNKMASIDKSDIDLDWLVKQTSGYSGAEVVAVIKEAFHHALRQNPGFMSLSREDFESALNIVRPETNQQDVQFYEEFSRKHCLHL